MILEDLKGQSRRIQKRPKDMQVCGACWFSSVPHGLDVLYEADGRPNIAGAVFGTTPYLRVPACDDAGVLGGRIRSPYGTRGDRLWVREACRELEDGSYLYRADVPDDLAKEKGPWKNVRFVPKAAARIWLEVLDVQIQRLHALTDEDAIAEGVIVEPDRPPRETFARMWDLINGKRDAGEHAWCTNPWVWRLSFRRVEP